MIWIAFAAAVSGHGEFGASMNRYMACLSAGLPSDLTRRGLEARASIYRMAAARCQGEREGAIDAAIRNRTPSQSEAQARAQAIDIIDTLDPLSSCRLPGSKC